MIDLDAHDMDVLNDSDSPNDDASPQPLDDFCYQHAYWATDEEMVGYHPHLNTDQHSDLGCFLSLSIFLHNYSCLHSIDRIDWVAVVVVVVVAAAAAAVDNVPFLDLVFVYQPMTYCQQIEIGAYCRDYYCPASDVDVSGMSHSHR
jgi:hypothetical protein